MLVLIIYGKTIRKKITLYRLRKSHEKFLENYKALVQNIQGEKAKTRAEEALNYWKRYMEKMEKIPYTRLTTKEVALYTADSNFINTLKNVDRNIYGKYNQEEIKRSLNNLEGVADNKYNDKVEEVNNK